MTSDFARREAFDPLTGQQLDTFGGLLVNSVLWIAVLWTAVLLIVFVPPAIRLYRKLT